MKMPATCVAGILVIRSSDCESLYTARVARTFGLDYFGQTGAPPPGGTMMAV